MTMKKLWFAGGSKDEEGIDESKEPDSPAGQDITGSFNPEFAKELEERGYIPDASHIMLADVKDIETLDICVGYDDFCAGKGLTSLSGIEYFESLFELYCVGNRLISLDVSRNPNLTELVCSSNQLSSLDVSGNPALTDLYCDINPGDGESLFPVMAWFENGTVPESIKFNSGWSSDDGRSWVYDGKNMRIDFRKVE